MTAEEIRNSTNESDDGAWECARWVREIAAQLADANESSARAREKSDQLIAEAKEKSARKSEFLDSIIEQIAPLVPKLKEYFEQVFTPPDFTPYPVGMAIAPGVPPSASQDDAPILSYLESQGHSPEKAQQILTNHRGAVLAEMRAVPPVAAVPDPLAAVPGGE